MKIEFARHGFVVFSAKNEAEIPKLNRWVDLIKKELPELSQLGETPLNRSFVYQNTLYSKGQIKEKAAKAKAELH